MRECKNDSHWLTMIVAVGGLQENREKRKLEGPSAVRSPIEVISATPTTTELESARQHSLVHPHSPQPRSVGDENETICTRRAPDAALRLSREKNMIQLC